MDDPVGWPISLHTIKLKTTDNVVFVVDTKIAKRMKTIKQLIETLNLGSKDMICVANTDSSTLRKILNWLNYHKFDPPKEEGEPSEDSDSVTDWDAEHFKIDFKTMLELAIAHEWLEVEGLEEIVGKCFANNIKDKSVEEMMAILKLKDDLTPAEKEKLAKLTTWCEDDGEDKGESSK